MKKLLVSIVVILLLCGSMTGCYRSLSIPPIDQSNLSFAADYNSVYSALADLKTNNRYYAPGRDGVLISDIAVGAEAKAASPSSSNAGNGNPDYSNTNVQVAGIDEGDIVKTDGVYIYSLRNNKLSIYKADGANTRLISTTEVTRNTSATHDSIDVYQYEYAVEMYLSGGFITVITQFDQTTYDHNSKLKGYEQLCNAYIYNVSDPIAPKLIYKLGQDGNILASRLIGNTLYLLSTYYVYDFSEDKPETFVPAIYTNDTKTLIAPNCIAIMPTVYSTTYTIVSAIDIPSGTITANQTLLGGGSTVYMSANNLYIADNEYKRVENTTDYGVYSVTKYLNYTITNITRLDVSRGSVEVAAYGSVPGYLGNQFYMDEYEGFLRVVTTDNSSNYSVYRYAVLETVDFKWDNNNSSSGLYVLDMSLTRIGSVENLAPGERVYSVRFDGKMGYFVTFRTVDPLFAVDLSKPQKPVVLSALKIPGFSQYLHVYSDGLLFGLGYSADEITGMRGSMKLSMFDTSNPKDVTEAHTLLINANYSSALYNHKAIVVDHDKNIIGFPTDSEYCVYGYDNQTGFFLRARISLNSQWWDWNSRGLYISEFFYVVSEDAIAVIDMQTFQLVKTISGIV